MTGKNNFSEKTIDPDPFVQFKTWYGDHLTCGLENPGAVTLATASKEGRVSARTVLLKEFNEKGFIFFTNYKSRKSSQLSLNARAALLFYWPESGRQVRIEGVTEKVHEEDSDLYFRIRPRESQLAAWASEQSSIIPNRHHLDVLYDFYKKKYSEKQVNRPDQWGGIRLIPEWFEFWQEGEFRLHDRLTYSKRKDLWIIERLAP